MAIDMLVDSTELDNGLTTIADAIRAKGGTSALLAFPNGMAQAVEDIPTGITPTGSITLTAEDTYDVTDKASAVVDFSATRADLAEAVTAKGVDTLPTASFDTIATNIGLIEGGGLPNVRKFTVNTDSTLGANGGITVPVVTSGRAIYVLKSNAGLVYRPYNCGILSIDYAQSTKAYHVAVRYDNFVSVAATSLTITDGSVQIIGGATWQMQENYTVDVYEIIL